MTLVLIGGLAFWCSLAQRNVRMAEASMDAVKGELAQSEVQLRQLDEMISLQKQWRQQDQILSRLGPPVDAARLLNALDRAMPPRGMALKELTLETVEQPHVAASLAEAREAQKKEQIVDRRLKVKLCGVAPSDVDLANFLARLGAVPLFRDVSMTYAKERSENRHVMREFEVTFSLSLAPPGLEPTPTDAPQPQVRVAPAPAASSASAAGTQATSGGT
jgi:hypothetical protein